MLLLSTTKQSRKTLQDIVREPEALKNNVKMKEENEKIISEIKEKLIGRSYSEIQDILVTVQVELMDEVIYQNPV